MLKDRITANNALWAELEAMGYHCGGYDFNERASSVVQGRGRDSQVIGWVRAACGQPGYYVEWAQ